MSDQGVDQEARDLFEKSLRRALEDEETKASLTALSEAGAHIDTDEIRAELPSSPGELKGSAKTMLEEWTRAAERLEMVKAERLEDVKTAIRRPLVPISIVLAVGVFLLLGDPWRWAGLSLIAIPLMSVYMSLWRGTATVIPRMRASGEARKRFEKTTDAQMAAAVREAINRQLTSFATRFRIFDKRGLRQLADPDREVPTHAVGELEGLIASLDSGSIGLSGPRGCGKTTLIKSFTDGRTMPIGKELVGLTVAAPVRYDARDFVLHLFASLCERVRHDHEGSRLDSSREMKALQWLGIATVGSAALGAYLYFEPRITREMAGIALLTLGYLLLVGWSLAWLAMHNPLESLLSRSSSGTKNPNEAERRRPVPPEQAAKDYLKQIRFQQSRTVGQSLEINLPFGLGTIGGSGESTLTRAPWTLPDAVAEFRRFAATLSKRYVVIGIDELDKMESDEAAREFLNNVKGVFGVSGCYFLVSVSEDAMSAFERRGLPLRDVFDSSFDEIQRIGFLDLEQSRIVMESRVTGIPVPFQCLCHCLGGGLPRDLIRVTRELVHHYEVEKKRCDDAMAQEEGEAARSRSAEITIATLTERMIETEWRGKLAGATAAGFSSTRSQPWWLTQWLYRQAQGIPDSESLRAWTVDIDRDPGLAEPDDSKGDQGKAQRVAVEMMVFNYYAATVLDLFGSEEIGAILTTPSQPEVLAPRNGWVETLATARQQFSVDPWLSWGLVEEAREATGLASWAKLRTAPAKNPRKWWDPRL